MQFLELDEVELLHDQSIELSRNLMLTVRRGAQGSVRKQDGELVHVRWHGGMDGQIWPVPCRCVALAGLPKDTCCSHGFKEIDIEALDDVTKLVLQPGGLRVGLSKGSDRHAVVGVRDRLTTISDVRQALLGLPPLGRHCQGLCVVDGSAWLLWA